MQEDTYVDYQIKCTSSIGNKVKQRFSWGKKQKQQKKDSSGKLNNERLLHCLYCFRFIKSLIWSSFGPQSPLANFHPHVPP